MDTQRLFDGAALLAALEAERGRRRLAWRDVAAETGVSVSTLKAAGSGRPLEMDGALCMVRWLGCPLEAFSPANRHLAPPEAVPAGRFDTAALHAALDAARRANGVTWAALASSTGVPAGQMAALAHGPRTSTQAALALLGWLGRSASEFTGPRVRRGRAVAG